MTAVKTNMMSPTNAVIETKSSFTYGVISDHQQPVRYRVEPCFRGNSFTIPSNTRSQIISPPWVLTAGLSADEGLQDISLHLFDRPLVALDSENDLRMGDSAPRLYGR